MLVGKMKASCFSLSETSGPRLDDHPPAQEVRSEEVCVGVKAGKRNASPSCQ